MQFNTLFQPNFWLNNLFLPWDIRQRFLDGAATSETSYHMPAEWEPHQRSLLAWPDTSSMNNDVELHQAWTEVAKIANTISEHEEVWLYSSEHNAIIAKEYVSANVTIKTNHNVEQLWLRDTGPILTTSESGKIGGIDLNFGYYDGKLHFPHSFDRSLAWSILKDEGVVATPAGIVAEGGAIEVDGDGTVLVTESSLLSRNPGTSEWTIGGYLQGMLGATKVIYLPGISSREITDGHIDRFARFAPNNTVLLSRPNSVLPKDDVLWRIYWEHRGTLEKSTNAVGEPFNIIEIEEAASIPYEKKTDSRCLPATSYTRFYVANEIVLVQQFGEGNERTDAEALSIMRKMWPERGVVGMEIGILAHLGGGVRGAVVPWPHGGDTDGREQKALWRASLLL